MVSISDFDSDGISSNLVGITVLVAYLVKVLACEAKEQGSIPANTQFFW